MTGEEILLQTRNLTYDNPPELNPSTLVMIMPTRPLTIMKPPIDVMPKMVKVPLWRARSNSKATHNYSIVDDLAQSPSFMSVLEVP